MSFSLYDALVPSFQQVLNSVSGLLDKAESHCATTGIDPEAIIEAKLAEDMLPFSFQIRSVATHSFGAIKAAQSGEFSPARGDLPKTFADLKSLIAEASAGLQAVDAAVVNELLGKPVRFQMRETHMDFVAEEFLLSFSQPNFYFHAVTAYDILRWKGLEIGKRDFLGAVRKI